jgi:hypothetical protein
MEYCQDTPTRRPEATERDDWTQHPPLLSDRAPLHPILQLQQSVGNRALQRLLSHRGITLQPKLTVGAAHDPYEQEADRVAQQVMRMPIPPSAVTGQVSVQPPSPEKDEVEQNKPLAGAIMPIVQRAPDEDAIQAEAPGQSAPSDPQGSFEPGADFEARLSNNGGSPLSASTRAFMEPRFGADFSGVQVHTGSEAAQLNRAVGAQAFTHGQGVYLGEGKNDLESSAGKQLLAHELTHTIQQGANVNASTAAIQRKEVSKDSEIQGPQDWTITDRESNAKRWQDACLVNLSAVDSSQYMRVVERRDFYKWFYEYTAALGYSTRWALAAYVVANGAHQIADMDVDHAIANDTISLANVELQGAMREGNQIIFDNVLPKLSKLLAGGPLKGPAALKWDMQILAEEQTLVQPMYKRMSKETVEQLDYIARKKRFVHLGAWWTDEDEVPGGPNIKAGVVPGFDQANIQNIGNRWRYGMELGNKFTPGGTGFDPSKDMFPAVSAGYQDGGELAKVDTRAHLHELDAWLNPNRLTRVGPGSNIRPIIANMSEFEKKQVLFDRSADGWAYSIQFAQFGSITEATVRGALPSDPSLVALVTFFLARYNAERTQVQRRLMMLNAPVFPDWR